MPGHDIIVIGASAGGVEALIALARGLPADLPASLFVVNHFPPHGTSLLPEILTRAGPLPATHGTNGEEIAPGRIYIAPPNYHLLIKRGHITLARGPRENGHRPAIDPLFRTAARAYGPRVIGVILTGTLDDGTAGLWTIKRCAGLAVVQEPSDALYSGMPLSALENVAVDHVVPLSQMPSLLARLAKEPVEEEGVRAVSEEMQKEAAIAELDMTVLEGESHPGTPASLGCPECGGTLWELTEEEFIRFRCRVGHAYTADTLLAEQTESLEAALWTALRALEEKASLTHRLIERARRRGNALIVGRFEQQVRDTHERARVIRQFLLTSDTLNPTSQTGETVSMEGDVYSGGKPPGN
jgi:two-component system chemotaxis response regulator CheB